MDKSQSLPNGARVKRPERKQIEWMSASLDQLIPADHRVRIVWCYVDSLDFTPLYQQIQAVEGQPGRDATDPKILMALWMFATIEGVSSARQLDRLSKRDLAYLWICGGVGVNYHMLSDFHTGHREFLDRLLTDTIATLMPQGLVTLETVAQKKGSGGNARCSTTDPEARTMKMSEGGFRPAYNVQFATDGDARVIVSVDVTNSGSDRGQMQPMQEDVEQRYGKAPEQYLVDGGFATKEDITALERSGSQVFAPVQREEQMRDKGQDPYARRSGDTDEMFGFRQRMATDPAKETFKRRPSIAEFPNAECRNRGLNQFRVRGLEKVKVVTLWYALTFNFLRMIHLGCVR